MEKKTQLDILYRAFLDYRRTTEAEDSCSRMRQYIRRANTEDDNVEAIYSRCTIDRAWVDAIEKGIPFIVKAIQENRQFIRQEGEILPIEKVKRVSKESVNHLARHGNLVTHAPENPQDDLTPDKLYTVKKETNSAVYENRFLYLLLCRMKEFVDFRYTKIEELGKSYQGRMSMQKKVRIGKRTMSYDVAFTEEAKDDPNALLDRETQELLDRIKQINKSVAELLRMPLMVEVSDAPLIRTPITRTNVLKMDHNFKQALLLFDFLESYDQPGFQVEVIQKNYNPFPDAMGDEFAELLCMTSFLVYEYVNELGEGLHDRYQAEEAEKAAEAAARQQREIEQLMKNHGHDLPAYIRKLEKCNADQKERLEAAGRQATQDKETIEAQAKEIFALSADVECLHGEYAEMYQALCDRETETLQIQQAFEEEKRQLMAQCEEAVNRAKEEARAFYETEKAAFIESQRDQNEARERTLTECKQKMADVQAENDRLTERNTLLSAEVHGLRQLFDKPCAEDDFTSKERYEELCAEIVALDDFLNRQWRGVKRKIRHEYLWKKNSD